MQNAFKICGRTGEARDSVRGHSEHRGRTVSVAVAVGGPSLSAGCGRRLQGRWRREEQGAGWVEVRCGERARPGLGAVRGHGQRVLRMDTDMGTDTWVCHA